MIDVGIDHMATYIPHYFLSLKDLAAARNVDEKKYLIGIGIVEMSVPTPFEDVVVLAANAGRRVLKESGVSPSDIGMLVVGTESAEDRAKPTATHVHALLGVSESCRVFDIVHACAGASYALVSALDWVRGSPDPRYALVIAADIARYGVGSPGEPTQGAGAVAMLVSRNPRLIKVEEISTYSCSVYDFWKPVDQEYPIVKGVFSVQCYLKALVGCFNRININKNSAFVYHTPYPKLVEKAHAEVVSIMNGNEDWQAHYRDKVLPSTYVPSKVGNTYTASLWLSLVSLLESAYEQLAVRYAEAPKASFDKEGIYMFSYGSGSGAVLMRSELAVSWRKMAALFRVRQELDSRHRLTVAEYESLFEKGPILTSKRHKTGYYRFAGVRNFERIYSTADQG